MDDWFTYYGMPKKERLAHAIKQLPGKAYSWWKRVDKTHGKSPEEVVTNWKDLKDVMIRKYVTTLPTQETRRKYPRRFSNDSASQMPTVLYDKYQPYEVPKAMEKKNLVSQYTLARHKEKSDKPIFQEQAKDVKTGPEVQKDTITQSLLRSKVVHDLSPRDKEILNPNKEEPSSQGLKEQEFKEEEPPGVTLVMDQKIVQEAMQSILLKEAKPKHYQGKALESQKRMKADLLYLGADYTVLRSKPCQEGGDDVVIRSATEPEVNPKPYSTSQGAKQNTCALKMPYLTNHEVLSHETNFNGLYTQ
ncbi:hypothetical protein F2Q69_00013702 [Brassica cretica]|uniref:Retrotransposon gag domain-containing protein n=1 Tax=Brassica cretica TaxID=69181 RepID=A0A8S9R001_BRACR|nr:hypothetical protein F2Q69_00013702 [Brassica cretica]